MINPIMTSLLKGMNNREIAASFNISVQAVKHRKNRLFNRMQVNNSIEAVLAYLLPLDSSLRNWSIMKKLLLLFLLCPLLLQASTTNITATITGADSVVWANGSYIISFRPTPGKPLDQFNVNGATFPQGPFTGAIDNSGTFTITLTDSLTINPSGSMWLFTICPNATFQCFSINVTVTGATQNLSTTLSAAAPAIKIFASIIPKAYNTNQVTSPTGTSSTFYNVTDGNTYIWNGSVWVSNNNIGTVTHNGNIDTGSLIKGGTNGVTDITSLSIDPTQCTGTDKPTGIDKTGAAKGCSTVVGSGTVTHTGNLNAIANAVPVGSGAADLTASACSITAGIETCTGFSGPLTGTSTGLDAQYIDWNSVSGGNSIANKPTLGTAAAKDIPAVGDASVTQVVYGTDTRLTNSRTPTAHASTHVTGGGDTIANAVSGGNAGLMSGADKAKEDSYLFIDPTNTHGWTGSDVGAWINAAAAALGNVTSGSGLALKSGIIQMAPGDYTCSTQAIIPARVSLFGAGKRMTYLTSTLNGSSCIKIVNTAHFSDDAVDGAQKIDGFSIIGNANNNTGGLEYGDVIGLELNDIEVQNFTGTGSWGILTTAYSWFTERAQWRNIWIQNSTCNWKIAAGAGALDYPNTTVGYGNFEAYLNPNTGQTGICAGVGHFGESTLHVIINMNGTSPTAVNLAANAIWESNLINIHVEGGTTPNGLLTTNGSWFNGTGVADFFQPGMTNTLNGRVNFSFTDENGLPRYASYGAAGATTTCAFTTGGGSSPSCAVASGSNDLSGTIIATTGTGSPSGTGVITLTYSCSGCVGATAPTCTYTASDDGSAAWDGLVVIKDTTPTITSDVFTWTNGVTPTTLSTSSTYKINYRCSPK